MAGDDTVTAWIAERNRIERQLRTCEEGSIRALLEIKLDRVKRKIDELCEAEDAEQAKREALALELERKLKRDQP